LILLVEHATPHTKLHRGYSSARMGQRNVSEWVHQYGCLVLRGSKCILARRGDYACIPVTEPRAYESKQQAATRAIAESCNIFSEEIALVHDVPAAVAYLPDIDGKGPIVLSVFIAMAANQSNECGCDEPLDSEKEKRYDWYDFEQAMSFVKTKAEQACISSLTSNLATAVDAGVVILSTPSAFRPKVHAIDGDLSLHQMLALTALEQPKGMLCDYKPKETQLPKGTPQFFKKSDQFRTPQLCTPVSQEGATYTSLLDFENDKRQTRMAKREKGGCCGGKCGPGCC